MSISDWVVNPNSPLPYYYQVERFLEQEIQRGDFTQGEELPSEGDLSKKFSVSISVVRQALKRLEENDIIERKKGKRAVIKGRQKNKIEFMYNQLSHYAELKAKGFNFTTKVMESSLLAPSKEIKTVLGLDIGEKVIKLSRLRKINDTPILFWTSYLPQKIFPNLESLDLNNKSLYGTMLEIYSIKPKRAERSFEVIMGEPDICELLGIQIGTPVIFIEWLSFLENGTPIEFYKGWHVSSNWKFIFHSGDV